MQCLNYVCEVAYNESNYVGLQFSYLLNNYNLSEITILNGLNLGLYWKKSVKYLRNCIKN